MLIRFPSSQMPLISPFKPRKNILSANDFHDHHYKRRRTSPPRAVEKESHYEIDREKARKALEKLDEQLETLSQKEATSKKRVSSSSSSSSSPAPEPILERDLITGVRTTKDMPELSGSYLTYSAVVLLILSFFTNIIFTVFIQPSVDGSEQSPPTVSREPLSEAAVKQAPQLVQ